MRLGEYSAARMSVKEICDRLHIIDAASDAFEYAALFRELNIRLEKGLSKEEEALCFALVAMIYSRKNRRKK